MKHATSCDPATLSQGELLAGKYLLKRPLCSGDAEVVWRAHHEGLHTDVAIKLLSPNASELDTARRLGEARAAAGIEHEGVVRIFDFGETAEGQAFIAMELVLGETLRERLRRDGPMTPVQAVKILLPVAHAWCALAERGLVHRAITLDDVVLTRSGDGHLQPKLLDFGAPHDPLGDVLSFAAMLFEVLAGKPPFASTSLSSTLDPMAFGIWPPMSGLDVHDRALEDIVYHGLRRDPAGRIPSMRAFGTALALWAAERRIYEDITGASLQEAWLGPAPGAEARVVVHPAVVAGIATETEASGAAANHAAKVPRLPPEVVTVPLDDLERAARQHPTVRVATRGMRLNGTAATTGRDREMWSWVAAAALATVLAAIAVVSFRRDPGARHEGTTAAQQAPLPAATPTVPASHAEPPAIAPTVENGATPPDRHPRNPFRQ